MEEDYKEFKIKVTKKKVDTPNGEKDQIYYEIYKSKNFLFKDNMNINGSINFTSERQAINDAKKNIDTLIRLKVL